MAGRNHRLLKQTYRLFASAGGEADGPAAAAFVSSPVSSAGAVGDDFEESDVWGSALSDGGGDDAGFEYGGKTKGGALHVSRGASRKPPGRGAAAAAASLPVNIPDWSQILREECIKRTEGGNRWDAEDEEEDGAVVPPHEYLWRKRGAAASFSVHEGVGRTLKGRDLSRVRNAVWQKTGFQD